MPVQATGRSPLTDHYPAADFAGVLRRNLLLVVLAPLVCVGLAVLYVATAHPSYKATASLRIDDRQPRVPVLDQLYAGTGNEVSTEVEMLRSRRLAEAVVDTLGLQLQLEKPRGATRAQVFSNITVGANTPTGRFVLVADGTELLVRDDTGSVLARAPHGAPLRLEGLDLVPTGAAASLAPVTFTVANRGDAVDHLQDALAITRRSRDANIVDVTYVGGDPELVRAVPNVLVSRFIAERQDAQHSESRSTAAFLREQTARLAIQLRAAEDTLQQFRQAEQIVSLPDQASSGVNQMAALQAERNNLEAEREALAQLIRSDNDSVTTNPIAFPTLLRNQVAASLLDAIAQAENRRSDLLLRRSMNDPDVQAQTSRINDLQQQLRGIATTYLQGLRNQVGALDSTLRRSRAQLASIPAKQIRLAELDRNVKGLEDIYTQLQARLKEAEVAEAVQDPTVQLVDPAVLPRKRSSPRPLLSIVIALLAGGILGLGASLTRDYMDRSIHTRRDVLAATGLPVLGVIPHGNNPWRLGKSRKRLALTGAGVPDRKGENQHELAEAFVRLAVAVRFADSDSPLQVIAVTSALPEEGKTTAAVNLALTIARGGRKTLLIDADVRRGTVHRLFGLPRGPGLTEVLSGTHPSDVAVSRMPVPGGTELHIISCGAAVRSPAQLLGTAALGGLLAELRKFYEFIVIDSAPINVVADATLIADHADGVLVVARAGVTRPEALNFSLEQLRHVHAPVVGTILNDIDYRRDGVYADAYQYYSDYLAP